MLELTKLGALKAEIRHQAVDALGWASSSHHELEGHF